MQNNIGVHEEYIPVVRKFGVNPQNEKKKEEIKKNRDKNYSSPTRLDVNQFDQNENENHFIESIGTLGNKRKKGDHAEGGENKTSHELKKINDKRHDEKQLNGFL